MSMNEKLNEQGLRRVTLGREARIAERPVWRIEDRPREVREALERAGVEVLALRPVDVLRPARGADEELLADEDGEVIAARAWRVETSWENGFFPLYVEVLW